MADASGRRVLITGGGRGLGLEMGRLLARRGATVVLADLAADAVAAARDDCAREADATVHGFAADVTEPDDLLRLHRQVHDAVGPIDVLVNNAGIVHGGPFLEVGMDAHAQTFDVNVLGLVAVTHAFLHDLIAADDARLVNVASASAYIGLPRGATYAASKWAVLGFSESLREELRADGHRHVRVTTACPSYVGTGLFDGARPPRFTRVMKAEDVARGIVDAALAGRRHWRAPWIVKLTPFLRGVLPGALFDATCRAFGAHRGMATWRGRGAVGGSMHPHDVGDDGSR